jgi:WD repeat-containing protein 23
MSAPHSQTNPTIDEEDSRTVVYDPNDPFWEDDDDDMDTEYVAALGGSEDEDDEGDISFHGTSQILFATSNRWRGMLLTNNGQMQRSNSVYH